MPILSVSKMEPKCIIVTAFLLVCLTDLCIGSCELAFKDCGSKAGKMSSAVFNATCDTSKKAILKQGTTVSITFNFTAMHSEANLTSKVYGKIGVLPFVSFPLDNPDACKNSGLHCPIPANTMESYRSVLKILPEYPKVNVIVKWELKNKNGEDVFCTLIPAMITA